ncbi:MAG: rhamnan synthesis F family protein, partial [Candidatus Nanoperiomorbaceae bacterium]
AEVLTKYSQSGDNRTSFSPYHFSFSRDAKLAIIVHLYYPNMWSCIAERLTNVSEPFDLYITTRVEYSNLQIDKISDFHKNTNIIVTPNRGRDVLPFLMIANRIRELRNYDKILKLHTKKSLHRKDGGAWFDELLNDLLSQSNIKPIAKALNDRQTGAVGSSRHLVSLSRYMGGDELLLRKLITKMSDSKRASDIIKHKSHYPYFGGTMFWCRMDYLNPLLDLYMMPSDFPSERGQVDGTMAHAVERSLGKILHDISGKAMYSVYDGAVTRIPDKTFDDKYKYAE